MDVKEIIKKNNGTIIKEGENMFDPWTIECSDNHKFELLANDLKNSEWCPECEKIDKILKDMSIFFEKDKKIEKLYFKYVIDNNDRKFIIDEAPFSKEKYKIAQQNNYKLIIIHDYTISDLKEKIWDTLKNNTNNTQLGEKYNYNITHQCTNEEIVKFINKDSRSVIKSAPKPYPQLKNIAVGYIRVSTEKQASEGHSLQAQEALLARESARRNFFLRAIYLEEGISGKDIEHREALKRMMKELNEGEKVIIYAVERFTRSLKDLLTLAEEIKTKKCELIVPDMDIDFNSPQGGLMLTIRGIIAQYEREITSKRVKDTFLHLKNTGRYTKKPFYGWKVNPDKSFEAPLYIRNTEEQKIIENIRLLRERYSSLGITAFTRKVNEAGVFPSRSSKQWYHSMLKDLMIREGIWNK